jgi:O-methyltransferase
MKQFVRNVCRRMGFDLVKYHRDGLAFPPDVSEEDRRVVRAVHQFTATSLERRLALIQAARHVARARIPGCVVECGVWRGGSSMAVALTLIEENDTSRDLYLFDTFEGMTPPTAVDTTPDGVPASRHLERDQKGAGTWCYSALEEVKANMASTGYPKERLYFVKGPVEETIPAMPPPGPIALLRLDTDWYESTRHELVHLFPRVPPGGIVIIDDYGHWLGARKATDEYLASAASPYFLHRIDYTGRLLIKK